MAKLFKAPGFSPVPSWRRNPRGIIAIIIGVALLILFAFVLLRLSGVLQPELKAQRIVSVTPPEMKVSTFTSRNALDKAFREGGRIIATSFYATRDNMPVCQLDPVAIRIMPPRNIPPRAVTSSARQPINNRNRQAAQSSAANTNTPQVLPPAAPQVPSLAQWRAPFNARNLPVCGPMNVRNWLRDHPNTRIAIRAAGNPNRVLTILRHRLPEMTERSIVIAKSRSEFQRARVLGYRHIFMDFTQALAIPDIKEDALIAALKELKPKGIILPASQVKQYAKLIDAARGDAHVYAADVTSCAQLRDLKKLGVDEAYTSALKGRDCQ